MRFLTLLKKELREALPWLLLTAIIFIFVGSLLLWSDLRKERFSNGWSGWTQNPGRIGRDRFFPRNVAKSGVPISLEGRFGYEVQSYSLVKRLPLSDFGPLLVFSSAGLGLVLAVRQFLVPSFFKTWSFTIHRSMSRYMILLTKFAATIIAIVISVGLTWVLFFLYTSKPGVFSLAPGRQMFFESLVYIFFGLVVYLGAALSSISAARWYATRIFGLVFAIVISVLAILPLGAVYSFLIMAVAILVLAPQIFHIFLTREF
jgi:hypothetical protein